MNEEQYQPLIDDLDQLIDAIEKRQNIDHGEKIIAAKKDFIERTFRKCPAEYRGYIIVPLHGQDGPYVYFYYASNQSLERKGGE